MRQIEFPARAPFLYAPASPVAPRAAPRARYSDSIHGSFLVHDPADSRVSVVTPAALARFIAANPNGGWQIAVG